jgi:REP element-mobilizing transposase RayT
VVRIGIHLVWATKHRCPWLEADVRRPVILVLAHLIKRQGCRPLEIGGWLDHVHLYLRLSPEVAVAQLVVSLKANSTRWIKSNIPGLPHFQWQRGFAAYSVDPRDDAHLRAYIRSQEQIHAHRTLPTPGGGVD